MRSRYTAYVMGLEDYLLQTWHASTCPLSLDLSSNTQTKWLGLQVKNYVLTGDAMATVEFVARYKIGGKAERMHELSRFEQINNRWYYLDGEMK